MIGIGCLLLLLCMRSSLGEDAAACDKLQKTVERLEKGMDLLVGQVMMQQLAHEERVRSDGGSGLKQTRVTSAGSRPYYVPSHTGRRLAAIHEHSNHIRTAGLGEFIAVLNGVGFKTRHNDFQLKRRGDPTANKFGATDNIEYPDVPPEVTSKPTLDEQIAELKEWFKAFRDSDHTVRDYRKYFKPVLCYLEGYWTVPGQTIDEPFDSERHQIDAKTWQGLLEKIRFSAYTGRKDAAENYAYLPTKIMEIRNGTAIYSQWNYRIACHNLTQHVPLSAFRVVDDVMARMNTRVKLEDYEKSRAARFQLNYRLPKFSTWREGAYSSEGFLDKLMSEIPGLDGYSANLTDNAYGYDAFKVDASSKSGERLNAGFYHRFFKEFKKGAMGVLTRERGYSDPEVFMAMTTNPNIASSSMSVCKRGWRGKRVCKEYRQKWTYAIPLEIIYMTPLQRWNPYNLAFHGSFKSPEAKSVTAGGRNGGMDKQTAYNGTNSNTYYLTPAKFFTGTAKSTDKADTARGTVGVLDQKGEVRQTSASGLRIHLPDIPEVGKLRQRWPIMPIHGEGSGVWKELDALKDLILNWRSNFGLFYE